MRNSLPRKNHEMSYSHQRSSSLAERQRAQEAEVLTRNHKFLTRLPLANLPKSCSRVPAAMTLVSEGSMDEDVAKDDVCFNNDFDFGSFCMINIKKQHSISSS